MKFALDLRRDVTPDFVSVSKPDSCTIPVEHQHANGHLVKYSHMGFFHDLVE